MNAGRIQQIKFTGPLALAMASLPFSVITCHVSLILFGIIWLADGQWNTKKQALLNNPLALWFTLFFLLHLLGIIYSSDKENAWFNIEKKFSLLAIPIMLASIRMKKEEIKQLFLVFLIACFIATLICLAMAINKVNQHLPTYNFDSFSRSAFYTSNPSASNFWMYFSYIELAAGISIHPIYLSLYLSFCVFLIFHLYSESFDALSLTKQICLTCLLIYFGCFIIFLSSRIMILGLLIISVYGINQFLKENQLIAWLLSGAVVLGFLTIIYLNPVSRFRNFQEVSSTWPYLKPGFQTQSTTIRASLWSLSIKSIPKINWIFGVGTGDVQHLISETAESNGITNVLGTNDPHNQYLQTFLGLGLLGLICLLGCFIWPAWIAYQTGNHLYLGFIFLFSLLCVTETALELQKGIVFYSLFNSIILFQEHPVPSFSFNKANV